MEASDRSTEVTGPSANGVQPARGAVGVAEIKDATKEAASSVGSLYRVGYGFLERQANERPYAVLGTAAGVGFILSGGLATRLAGVLLAAGGRILATHLIESSSDDRGFDE